MSRRKLTKAELDANYQMAVRALARSNGSFTYTEPARVTVTIWAQGEKP